MISAKSLKDLSTLAIASALLSATPFIPAAQAQFTNQVALSPSAPFDGNRVDQMPVLASNGADVWITAWCSFDLLGGPFGFDHDIFVSRTTNDGATWSNPAAVNLATSDGERNDTEPSIASDGQGNWMVVWTSKSTSGDAYGSDFDLFYIRSANDGVSWTTPSVVDTVTTNPATTDVADELQPRVISTGPGKFLLAWSSNVDGDFDVYSSLYDATANTWTTSVMLNHDPEPTPLNDREPALAVADDTVMMVWRQSEDLCYALYNKTTNNWSAAKPLNTDAATDSGRPDMLASIATNGDGIWVAYWAALTTGGSSHNLDIYRARYVQATDTWSAPVLAHDTPAMNYNAAQDGYPKVVNNGRDLFVAVWHSEDSMGGSLGTDNDLNYSVSKDAGLTWTTIAAANSAAMTDGFAFDGNVSLAVDNSSNYLMVWNSSYDDTGTGTDLDLFVAKGLFGPEMNLSTQTVAFGTVDMDGGSVTQDLIISNAASAEEDLAFSSISITDSQGGLFTFDSAPSTASLAPGASRTVTIRNTPSAFGNFSGSLTIVSNDPQAPTKVIPITANNTEYVLPTSLATGQRLWLVGASIPVDFAADGTGSPVNSVELWVRRPGQSAFEDSTLRINSSNSGTFQYNPAVNGTYHFYTVCRDAAGNVQTTSANSQTSTTVNLTANAPFDLDVPAGATQTFYVPMENDVLLELTFTNVTTAGTVRIQRIENLNAAPQGYDPNRLLNEIWSFTPVGPTVLDFSSANLKVNYQEVNLGGLTELEITTAFNSEGSAVIEIPVSLDPIENTISFSTPSFSSFYFGNANADVYDWAVLND